MFEGKPDENGADWIERVSQVAEAEHWDDARRRQVAIRRIASTALQWHVQTGHEMLEWDDWSAALAFHFTLRVPPAEWGIAPPGFSGIPSSQPQNLHYPQQQLKPHQPLSPRYQGNTVPPPQQPDISAALMAFSGSDWIVQSRTSCIVQEGKIVPVAFKDESGAAKGKTELDVKSLNGGGGEEELELTQKTGGENEPIIGDDIVEHISKNLPNRSWKSGTVSFKPLKLVCIPQDSMLFVYGKIPINYSGTVIVKNTCSRHPEKSWIIPSCLVTVTDGILKIPVMNLSQKTLRLRRSELVAQVSLDFQFQVSIVKNGVPEPEPSAVTCVALQAKEVPKIRSEIKTGDGLSLTEEREILNLLAKHFQCSPSGVDKIGCTGDVEHTIQTGEANPVFCQPYRVSKFERDLINEKLGEMLRDGINQPSQSPWSSPVVLVRKKSGDHRFCVDYRRLNAVTKRDVYPLPRMDDVFDCLAGAKIFSSLDLASGYWLVSVADSDRYKTAYFPAAYGPCTRAVKVENVPCLFGRYFGVWEDIWGTPGEIATSARGARKSQLNPQSKKMCVWNVSGLASFYRKFIADFVAIAHPLHALLKKNARWVWGETQEKAKGTLVKRLCHTPVLAHFDDKLEVEIQTNASYLGLEAVLMQPAENGPRPIAFISRRMTDAEGRHHSNELECLALVWALKKFQCYVYGRPFQCFKHVSRPHAGLLQPIPPPSHPFHTIGVDHLGPLKETDGGNVHVVVAIDYLTKWVEAEAVPTTATIHLAQFIKNQVINRHGVTIRIISDQGSAFTSAEMDEEVKLWGVKHVLASAEHPQTNGLIDRMNRSLTSTLAAYLNPTHNNWDNLLPDAIAAINTAKQSTTEYSPFQLVYGRTPNPAGDNAFDWPNECPETREEFLRRVSAMRRAIVRQVCPTTYLVEDLPAKRIRKRWRRFNAHVCQLKLFRLRVEEEIDDEVSENEAEDVDDSETGSSTIISGHAR
ncbi:Uncharacterized protein APZ42_021358 [Daphnia magna]|uniref:Integrase catalytic domain-containing protein n=1 Tax=Daphnia magna TaxID=35525 RepID=A0A164WRA7_9CRUS|nr:Uncharacterized protein APZ42_021358 [Daphnia magna]